MTGSHNKFAANLAAAGLIAQGFLAPGRTRIFSRTVTTTVTTTMRVVGSVHDDTADRRANAHMALTAGFADLDILMLFITDGADGCHTFNINQADFTTWQTNLGIIFLFGNQLGASASRAD
jgi:hypothetical protein